MCLIGGEYVERRDVRNQCHITGQYGCLTHYKCNIYYYTLDNRSLRVSVACDNEPVSYKRVMRSKALGFRAVSEKRCVPLRLN